MNRLTLKGRWRSVILLVFSLSAACRKGGEVKDAKAGAQSTEPSHLVAEQGEVGITLDSATVARIHLETTALRGAARNAETELPATIVPDPEATSFVRAGVAGRLSPIDGVAWPHFGSRLQAGESLAVIGDARPVMVARGGTVSRVLVQPGELVQSGQDLLELTRYDAPLVQVTWTGGLGEPPAALAFSAPGAPRVRVRGALVGPAPEADPVTREPAWLYRVSGGWKGMRPGANVSAWLADARTPSHGVLIPSAAVVQWDALAWAYREREPGRFVRVRVPTDHPVQDGWLVSNGFATGDRVVTRGAGQLLSEEFRARIVVGEEVGE
jgi:biotin carboxyl carrier protein